MKEGFNPKEIDEILSRTLESIDEGRQDIFEIAESARQEYESLEKELEEARERTQKVIEEVDKLERQNKEAKKKLAQVSKNFNRYSEKAIKDAYDHASNISLRLSLLREREKQMRNKRDEIERRLKGLNQTIQRAENVVNKLGAVKNYISQGLQDLGETLENLQQKQTLGLKIVRAQEEERRRVARDIHDGPAQGLANVVLRAEYCEKLLDQDLRGVREELSELKKLVRKSLQELRKIIFDLRPMTLDDLGLIPAIRRLVSELKEEGGLEGEVVVFGEEKRLPKSLEVALFRIVQEALNNVKKHAHASSVWIKAQIKEDKIIINVKDDGRGFDIQEVYCQEGNEEDPGINEKSLDEDSIGLQNIKERVETLGGELTISSRRGDGTTLSVKVPLLS